MADWKQILKKQFGETEKIFYIDKENNLFITIKKIDALKRKELTNLAGQIISSTYDQNNPERQIMVTQFTQEYDQSLKDQWRVLFQYGVDENKHSFEGEILNLIFWEKFSKDYPDLFTKIELEIRDFNNAKKINEDDKKKLN